MFRRIPEWKILVCEDFYVFVCHQAVIASGRNDCEARGKYLHQKRYFLRCLRLILLVPFVVHCIFLRQYADVVPTFFVLNRFLKGDHICSYSVYAG